MRIESCTVLMKYRHPYITIDCGILDVENGAFAVTDCNGLRAKIPVGSLACLMLGPGTTVTHAAVKLAAEVKCLLIWTGQNGIRLYSAGMPGGARSDRLLRQAEAALDRNLRLRVIRGMYQYRFNEILDENLSIEQLRGKEAYRIKVTYRELSDRFGIEWHGRRYDAHNWNSSDTVNRCISTANSCLYGISEAAILIAGYSPSIGFVHSGRPRSFVYDVADLIKFETVVPLAFRLASELHDDYEQTVRHECRDMFSREKILQKLVPLINSVFQDSDTDIPEGVIPSPEFSENDGRFYDGTDFE